jgi:hypothetical protein
MELQALAVTVEDADAETEDEQALFGEPGLPPPRAGWQRSILKALFADQPPPPRRSRCCWRRTLRWTCMCRACRPSMSRTGCG